MDIKQQIEEIFKKHKFPNTHLTLLELGNNNEYFQEKIGEEKFDFSNFEEYDLSEEELRQGSPVASFTLTGGLNGTGNWEDYTKDLSEFFKDIKKETELEPLIYKITTDIADDVWNAYIFLYNLNKEMTEDSLRIFKDSLMIDKLSVKEKVENRLNRLANKIKFIRIDIGFDAPGGQHITRSQPDNIINNELLLDKGYIKVNFQNLGYTLVPLSDLNLNKETIEEDIKKLTDNRYHDMVEIAANKVLLKDSMIEDVIREEKGGYVIYSEKGKKLSKVYKNKADAEKRLKEIEMFKHMKAKDSSYRGYDIEWKGDLWQVWKDTHDGDTKIAGDFDSLEEAQRWIDDYLDNPIKTPKQERLHKYDVYYTEANSDRYVCEFGVIARSPEEAKLKVKRKYGNQIYGYPHDAILRDSKKEIKDMSELENAKRFIESLIVHEDDDDNLLGKTYIRSLKSNEELPRGVKFRAGTDNSGIIKFHGSEYYYYLDNNDRIHIERHVHDSGKRFVCRSYFDDLGKGLEDTMETNDLAKAKEWIWEKLGIGFAARIIDMETGEVLHWDSQDDFEYENKDFDLPLDDEDVDLEAEEVLGPDEIDLYIVEWVDDKGYKHTIEYDDENMAKEFIEKHKNEEEYHVMKIQQKRVNLKEDSKKKMKKDSMEEVEVEIDGELEKLVDKGYKEFCKCAEKEPFEYSDKLIETLNEISKWTQTTETEIMQMYRELFEKETLKVQDSKLVDEKNIEEIKEAINKCYNYGDYDSWVDPILIKNGLKEDAEEMFENLTEVQIRNIYKEVREELKKIIKNNQDEFMEDQRRRDLIEEFDIKFKMIEDSPMKVISSENLKKRLSTVFEDYVKKAGLLDENDNVKDYYKIDIEEFVNDYGDKGIHIQLRNDLVGYYEPDWTPGAQKSLDDMIRKLDEMVDPGYFEPYYNTVWDAYIFDVRLSDKVEDEVADENDSTKLMDILHQAQDILKRALIEEGYEDNEDLFFDAKISVRHEKDGENDLIIVTGSPEWAQSDLEENVVNEVEDLIRENYAEYDDEKDFRWHNGFNHAGATFTIRSGKPKEE